MAMAQGALGLIFVEGEAETIEFDLVRGPFAALTGERAHFLEGRALFPMEESAMATGWRSADEIPADYRGLQACILRRPPRADARAPRLRASRAQGSQSSIDLTSEDMMPPPPTPAGGKTVHILSPPSVDMFETFSGNYSTLQVRVCLQNVVCVQLQALFPLPLPLR